MEQTFFTPEIDHLLLVGAGIIFAFLLPYLIIRMNKGMDNIVDVIKELTAAVNNNHVEHGLILSELGGRVKMCEKDCEDIPKLWELAHDTKNKLGQAEARIERIVFPLGDRE